MNKPDSAPAKAVSAAKLYEVIRAPRVSEKTARLQEVSNQYAFEVSKDATKADIKAAVEKIFDVKVAAVNTINRVGKARRTRFGTGKRKDTKRAIVTLKSGSIDIFTAVG